MFVRTRSVISFPSVTIGIIAKNIPNMRQGSIRRGLLKFYFYWVALVASCLIIFFISASQLTVKPLQFEAPVSTLDDVFLPDVCPPNAFRSYHHSRHISQVSLTAEAVSVDPISRTIVMNWYPELTNTNCTSNISRVFDLYIPRWVNRVCLRRSWTHPTSEGHSWIRAVPHGVLSSRTNQPTDSMVRGSAPGTKRFLRSELSRSLSLPRSILGFIPFPPSPPSRIILSMCKSNLCSNTISNSRCAIRYIAPLSIYYQNIDTGAIGSPKVSGAFGIAV